MTTQFHCFRRSGVARFGGTLNDPPAFRQGGPLQGHLEDRRIEVRVRNGPMQDRVGHRADVGLLSHHSEIDARVDGAFADEDKAFQLPILDNNFPVLTVTHVPVNITFVTRTDPAGEDGLSKDRQDIPEDVATVGHLHAKHIPGNLVRLLYSNRPESVKRLLAQQDVICLDGIPRAIDTRYTCLEVPSKNDTLVEPDTRVLQKAGIGAHALAIDDTAAAEDLS